MAQIVKTKAFASDRLDRRSKHPLVKVGMSVDLPVLGDEDLSGWVAIDPAVNEMGGELIDASLLSCFGLTSPN